MTDDQRPTQEDRTETFIHQYNKIRRKLAEAKARCKRSEKSEKRERALYMKVCQLRGIDTVAAQTRDWEASEQYSRWLDEDIAATLERDQLQADVDSAEMEWETWRTRRADRRAEIKLR